MRLWFWPLFAVNAVFAGLVVVALPWGPDVIYALMAGSQLGMLALLAGTRAEPRRDQRGG